jgi:hypothetical protein
MGEGRGKHTRARSINCGRWERTEMTSVEGRNEGKRGSRTRVYGLVSWSLQGGKTMVVKIEVKVMAGKRDQDQECKSRR